MTDGSVDSIGSSVITCTSAGQRARTAWILASCSAVDTKHATALQSFRMYWISSGISDV
jgi:hypothetical protein